MRNSPPPQNDSCYYAHGGWEYQEQETGYFPEPQNGPCFGEFDHYSSCGWEDQNQRDFTYSHPIHQEPSPLNYPTSPPSFTYPNSSSLEHFSAQNSFSNSYNSFHYPQDSFHYTQESYHYQHSNQRLYQPTQNTYSQPPYHSQDNQPHQPNPNQQFQDQLNRIEGMIATMGRDVADLKGFKEEVISNLQNQGAAIQKLEAQIGYLSKQIPTHNSSSDTMANPREESEEQEREKVNQGRSHSNETESCKEEGFIEPQIQEAFDEQDTPTVQQQPSSEIKDVKAVETSTKMRIVTEKQRTISMKKRRSKNNPTPEPTSKFTQANHKGKLAGKKHSQQGALTSSFIHLKSFLLTNWRKRKKVRNSMSS